MIDTDSKLRLKIEENHYEQETGTVRVHRTALHEPASDTVFEFDGMGGFIGRNAQCDLILRSSSVSSRHAKITLQSGVFHIEDVQSRNGTWVQGQALTPGEPYPLKGGEQIQVASCRLTVLSVSPAKPSIVTSIVPPAVPPAASQNTITPNQISLPENWMNQSAAGSTGNQHSDAPRPLVAPTPEAVVPSSETGGCEALNAAFFEGLGIQPPKGFQFDQASMKSLGKTLRVIVEGSSELLAARSFLKFAINANMTQFNTNPLKMGLKTDAVLEHLLTQDQKMGLDGQPSFKGLDLAFKEAFSDLKMHEIGLLGGFQTTLQRVLAKLSPEHIESTLASAQGVMKNIPVVKEVRLWDIYKTKYDALQSLVGEEGKPLAGDDLDRDLIEVFADDMLDGYAGSMDDMAKGEGGAFLEECPEEVSEEILEGVSDAMKQRVEGTTE